VFSDTNYTALNGMVIENDELERMGKDVILAYFKVLFQQLSGGNE
jgi:hypothetical protein